MADVNLDFSGLKTGDTEAFQKGLEKQQELGRTIFDTIKGGAKKLEEDRIDSFEKVSDANLQRFKNKIQGLSTEDLARAKIGGGEFAFDILKGEDGGARLGKEGYASGVSALQDALQKEQKSRTGEEADIANLEFVAEQKKNEALFPKFRSFVGGDLTQQGMREQLPELIKKFQEANPGIEITPSTANFLQGKIFEEKATSEKLTDGDVRLEAEKFNRADSLVNTITEEITNLEAEAGDKGLDINTALDTSQDDPIVLQNRVEDVLLNDFKVNKAEVETDGVKQFAFSTPDDSSIDPERFLANMNTLSGNIKDLTDANSPLMNALAGEMTNVIDKAELSIINDPNSYMTKGAEYEAYRKANPSLNLPAEGIEYNGKKHFPRTAAAKKQIEILRQRRAQIKRNPPPIKLNQRMVGSLPITRSLSKKNFLSNKQHFDTSGFTTNFNSNIRTSNNKVNPDIFDAYVAQIEAENLALKRQTLREAKQSAALQRDMLRPRDQIGNEAFKAAEANSAALGGEGIRNFSN